MAKALAAARAGFRRFFSISAFTPPPLATVPPPAEPSPNLFVSGLSKRTTSEGLREAFSKFGNIVHARVVTDRISGYSKGFGFVRYATVEEAAEGIKGMDGKFLDGWVIFAEYAKPRPPPPSQAQSSQASEPLSSHSNYTPKETRTPSNQSCHSAQTLETAPSCNSVPAFNYSSEMSPPPSGFVSVQASNYSQASESPNYPPSNLTSAQTFSFHLQASNPGNLSMQPSSNIHQQSDSPNNFPQNSEIPTPSKIPDI